MSVPPPTLSRGEFDALRDRLTEEHEKAERRRAGLSRDFDAIVASAEVSNADDEHDPEGQTIGFERAQVSVLLAEAVERLAELDRAAERLRDGRINRCERCRGSIAFERLLAAPTTVNCIDCATAIERARRRTGGRGG